MSSYQYTRGQKVWIVVAFIVTVVGTLALTAALFFANVRTGPDVDTSGMTETQKSQVYIEVIRNQDSLSRYTDNNLISMAKTGCELFDDGESFSRAVEILSTLNPSLTPTETGAILGAGTVVYCPEHKEKIDE